jgi:hypothetical protein
MKVFGRSPVTLSIGALVLFGGLIGFSYTVGKDTLVGSITITFVDKLKGATAGKLDGLKGLVEEAEKKLEDGNTPEDQPLVDRLMAMMFYEKDGFHFTQSRWGAAPVPYQFRGLQLVGPKKMTLNGADGMNGIDQRLIFNFYIDSYRRYDPEKGWGTWVFEEAPNLEPVILARKDGEWKLAASPRESYSVR